MKIAFSCDEYPPATHGGIGTFVHTIAHGLVDAGHQVLVVGLGPADEQRDDQGVRVVTIGRLPRRRGLYGLRDRLRVHRFLAGEVKVGRVEIIEVPEHTGPLPFRFSHCPVVVRLHSSRTTLLMRSGAPRQVATQWFERQTLKHHRNWIAVSQYTLVLTAEAFPDRSAARQRVIYSPIVLPDPVPPLAASTPRPYVLYAGSVWRMKGALVVGEAARKFLAEFPKLHLIFAGRVDAQERADEQIRQMLGPELAQRCHFLGHLGRPQAIALMQEAEAFVFPSTLETFGLVAAEAMLVGCPTIVSNMAPFTEFVSHGQTGLLVDPHRPDELAAAVSAVLKDREMADKLSRNGRELVGNRFSLERAIRETLEFYQSCLPGQPSGGQPSPAIAGEETERQ